MDVKTKKISQSKITWVEAITLLSNTLVFMLQNEGFINIAGSYLFIFQAISSLLVIYLRIFKTDTKLVTKKDIDERKAFDDLNREYDDLSSF